MADTQDLRRRNFLIRCCQGLALPFFSRVDAQRAPTAAGDDLHPHYRAQTPLDAVLVKANAALDNFAAEREHDQIAAILAGWCADLRAVDRALAPDFLGSSVRPVESKVVRAGPALEVRHVIFATEPSLPPDAFLREFHAGLIGFAKIVTAEFQVTRIDRSPGAISTRVRYELVGGGTGLYREQRVGYWDLEWTRAYGIRRWTAHDETRSRSAAPCFADITAQAFGGDASYSRQMLHGVDYWRTVLDGACGIDIYGHNGVSVGDIDGDGFDDLYVCQPAGLPNRLYRNRGDGTFEDITEASGVGMLENTACAIFADFANDGRQDLVVVRSNGPLLFMNEGGGKFRRKPGAFPFASAPQGTFTGAAAADYNRDGWLDIYFCLYTYYQGTGQYKYPVPYYDAENGPPNFLMRNNGDGIFRDVTAESGLNQNNTRYSFCCGWNDYNGDGWPDLYVVNDFGRKNLYRNNGDGTFTDVAPQAGVEDIGAGMSVCWFDYDNDGAEDLYVADMWTAAGERISRQTEFQNEAPERVRGLYQKHAMGNSLFRNHGAEPFQDATAAAGAGMGRWSWSSDAWDFDHDGYPDLYIANGMISGPVREELNSFFWRQVVAKSPEKAVASPDYEDGWNAINELIRADYTWSGYERNVFYANNRDGTFSDVSGAVGLGFIEDGRAFVLADFDHDGRQEMLLKNRNSPQLRLLKNVMEPLPPAVAVRLRGVKSNRDAIGAAVTVESESGRQTRFLRAGSGFLSQHSKELFFGLGDAPGPVSLSIRWPSGLAQRVSGAPANHRVWVEEGNEQVRMEPFASYRRPAARPPAESEPLPATVETWLLAPVPAPVVQGKVPQLLTINGNEPEDMAAVYNLLCRYLFDRHRDMQPPVSFLIDDRGYIVKVYQGPVAPARVEHDLHNIPRTDAERLARALPFPGDSTTYEFGRNYLSLGSIYFQHGYFGRSEVFFKLSLGDDPSSAEALYGLGSVFLKQEKTTEARDSFQRAVKARASYPDTLPSAWNNLGLLAARAGHTDEAIGYFQEALRASPGHFVALENLGNAYRQAKRWEDARKALEQALDVRPQDPEVNYSLGMVYAKIDDTGRAQEYLTKALQLRPGYPEALNNLGVLYLRTRRRDEAVAKFEECIRVAPAFDQAYLNLARVYSLEGAPEKARAVLRELLKQHPGHAQAQQALEQIQ